MRPVDVQKKDELALFEKMFGEAIARKRRRLTPELKPGEMVRVSKVKVNSRRDICLTGARSTS